MSAVFSIALTAALSVLGRLATAAFFEAVLTDVVVWCADKLSAMTTNKFDDRLAANIKKALGKDDAP